MVVLNEGLAGNKDHSRMVFLVYGHFTQYCWNGVDIESYQYPLPVQAFPQDDAILAIHEPTATKIVNALDLHLREGRPNDRGHSRPNMLVKKEIQSGPSSRCSMSGKLRWSE